LSPGEAPGIELSISWIGDATLCCKCIFGMVRLSGYDQWYGI
jgi:hypothetical protein